MTATATTPAATWLSRRERGTVFGIRAAFRLATLIGRPLTKPLVAAIAMWYRLTDKRAVRASQGWLERVTGERPGFWRVYRHFYTFAQVTMDRAFLLTDHTKRLRFTRTGQEHLEAQKATGHGAVLLGAHLGSYEAMRAGGRNETLRIKIVGYFANSKMINALMAELNPAATTEVIHLGEDPAGVMANVKDALERGPRVVDRQGPGDAAWRTHRHREPSWRGYHGHGAVADRLRSRAVEPRGRQGFPPDVRPDCRGAGA
jgi:predicted LPLAT superfamily acyltransferase